MENATQFVISLRGSERGKMKPRSIIDPLKEIEGVVIVGGDPLSGYEVLVPDDRVKDVRKRLEAFAHVEVDESLTLL